MVNCDNLVCVQVFQTGKGHNKILLESARSLWMLQALLEITITYRHISGVHNTWADALSRIHLGDKYKQSVIDVANSSNIIQVLPNLYVFSLFSPPMYSRARIPVFAGPGHGKTAPRQGSRHR